MGLRLLLPVLLLLPAMACAREEPPPGALPDNRPPRVVGIRPEKGAVVPDFSGAVRIRFNEPIQENRSLQRGLRASPADRFGLEFGFSEIRIVPRDGGWRPDVVYVLHLSGSISDIMGNRRDEPIEVVFSTGPPVTGTRVEGSIRDRVTGEAVRGARALFYRRAGDSVPYTAVQDTGSRFALEALPPDGYRAWGFEDLNGNRRLEKRLEPYDSAAFALEGPDAAASVEFRIVEPDSTPPVLASATPRDSLRVELRFDDPLEPRQELDPGRVSVRGTVDGERWPVEALALSLDRLGPGDGTPGTGPADTTAVADTAAAGARPGAGGRAPTADTLPRPSPTLFVRLGRPLESGGVYRVRADSLMNLRKLYGGGDTTFVYRAPADTAGRDSLPGGMDGRPGSRHGGRRP